MGAPKRLPYFSSTVIANGDWKQGQGLRWSITGGADVTMDLCNQGNNAVQAIAMTDAKQGQAVDVCFGGFCAVRIKEANGVSGERMTIDGDGDFKIADTGVGKPAPVNLVEEASVPSNTIILASGYFQSAPNTPNTCLLYTSPSPRDRQKSRMPSSA